jgi:hypothetical protein
MPNTCTICKHPEREQIESALASGQSLRNIASQFDVGYQAVNRHQTCIAAQLQAFKASQAAQLNETMLERLNRYRLVAERFLNDDEKALAALDRCFKQADIEAKLTGEYQKKQENKIDAPNREEIIIEAYLRMYEHKTYDEAVATMKAIFEASDEDSRRDAVRAAVEIERRNIEAFLAMAEEIVSKRIM